MFLNVLYSHIDVFFTTMIYLMVPFPVTFSDP